MAYGRSGAVALVLALCGCTAAAPPPGPPSVAASPRAPSPSPSDGCPATLAGDEVQGSAPSGTTLWGLLFSDYPLPRASEVKIVWRMTGDGDLTLGASGPGGRHVRPVWGPEPHGGSSWDRPGAEWGSGFRFPVAGCWTVEAARGGVTATAPLLVRGS